jgi:preprotein translocase subunit YajC
VFNWFVAMAQTPQSGGAGGGSSLVTFFLPILLMFVIIYFFMIRPQQKRQKEHQNMLSTLKKGDKVVTPADVRCGLGNRRKRQ